MSRRHLIGLALLALSVGLGGCGSEEAARPRVLSVKTVAAAPARFSDNVDTISTLEAATLVQLAAQAGGRIELLKISQGDRVRQGDLLLVLDQLQVQADVRKLRGQRDESLLNYRRYEFLVRQGAASVIQRDSLRQNYVAAAEALRARQADLAFRDLRSPVSGVISDLKVKIGDVIQAGEEITKVLRNDRLMARIDVPAALSNKVRIGQVVVLKDPLTSRTLAEGRVGSIDPTISASNQSLLVKAEFPNRDGSLRNGLRVATRLVLAERDQLSVPFEAVIQSSGQSFVFSPGTLAELERTRPSPAVLEAAKAVPAGTRFALQIPLQLGPLQNNRYSVLRGLPSGTPVITTNLLNLRHGLPVKAN